MAALLNVYNLGQGGVNVDKSPIHLDDNELTQAQNAVQNKQGIAGGLVNRPSLIKFDSDAAAGSLGGAISAPLGPGPASSTDDTMVYYHAMAVSPYWNTSSNSFSTWATSTRMAQPGSNASAGQGSQSAVLHRKLYYIARTVADNQSIRVFDGVQDRLFCALQTGYTFVTLATFKGALYATVANGTTAAYVFKIDSVGRIQQIGAALPTAIVNFKALGYHNNDLFVAGHVAGVEGKVYRIREPHATDTTAWTLDYTAANVNQDIISFCSFQGTLFAGRNNANAASPEPGAVLQRSAAGVYTSRDASTGVTGSPWSIVEFRGALYVAWYWQGSNPSKVRKSSNGTSWAQVFSGSNTTGEILQFYHTGQKLFLIGSTQSNNGNSGYWTADGATWTAYYFGTANFSFHMFGWFNP